MKRENISNCQENWDNMTPLNGGRFCHNCEKKVYDFTDMNKDEIIELQWRNNFSLCGMYSDKSFERRPSAFKMPKLKLKPTMAAGALVAGLAQLPLQSQSTELPKIEQTEYSSLNENIESIVKERLIMGKVIDKENGESLIGAVVILKGTDLGAATDFDGNFEFRYRYSGNIEDSCDSLEFRYIGYKTIIVPITKFISNDANQKIDFAITKDDIFIVKQEVQVMGMPLPIVGALECKKPPIHKWVWWKIKNIFR